MRRWPGDDGHANAERPRAAGLRPVVGLHAVLPGPDRRASPLGRFHQGRRPGLGVIVALTFIGLPFVVRTVQPVLQDLDSELEEAAASLGASRWQTFRRVIVPHLAPALITGFALAFARAVGEYGSVIFIAGNVPMVSEITPLLILTKLEQYDYAGAAAIAVVML